MTWLEEGLPASLAPAAPPAHDAHPDPGATATASRCSPAARPAATSRTSGSCCFLLRAPRRRAVAAGGDRRADVAHHHFPGSFYPRDIQPGELVVEDRLGDEVIDGAARRAATTSVVAGPGRSAGCARSAATRRPGCSRPAPNPRGMQGYAVGR